MSFRKSALGATLAVTLASPVAAHFEGLSLKPYLDPVGIWTVCYGETETEMRAYSETECSEMFAARLGYFALRVDQYVGREMPPEVHAAVTSFAYNVGFGKKGVKDGFVELKSGRPSSMLVKLRAGDFRGACNEFPKWNKANGRELRGLTKRRAKERELCLKGVRL